MRWHPVFLPWKPLQDLFADQQIGNLEDDPMVCTPSWSHSTSVGTLSSHGRRNGETQKPWPWGQQGGLKGEESHHKATAGFWRIGADTERL